MEVAVTAVTTGYKYRYVSEPDDALKCLICLEIAEEPWQHSQCGRLFCKQCLNVHGRERACPNCRTPNPQYFEDNKSKREIRALSVKCDNLETGNRCGWIGTVGTLHNHLATCQYTPVPCPKLCKDENGEASSFMRKDLDNHLPNCPNRDYECTFCGEKGTYVSITQVHDEVCDKKVIPCTNIECTYTVQRQELQKHIEYECEYTVIACKHKPIGCDMELRRKEMPAHEADSTCHLNMTLGSVAQLKEVCGSLQEKINVLEEGSNTIQANINSSNSTFREFRVDQRILNSTLRRDINSLTEQCRVLKRENTSMKEKCGVLDYMMKGSVTFKLTEFQSKKQSNAAFTSPCIYTGAEGYHVNLIIYANGLGIAAGTHVSLSVLFVEGKNWPFIGEVTVTLLNQTEDQHHYAKKMMFSSRHNITAGSTLQKLRYISHSDLLQRAQYLKDDTLYFRVSVEVANDKPWLQCTS